MDTPGQDKTPLEKLEDRLSDQMPENARFVKSNLLEKANDEMLTKWIDEPEAFRAEVNNCLKEAGKLRTTTHEASIESDMMTGEEAEGVGVTDDEVAAAAAAAVADTQEGEEN